jgi:hypothetical protein
MKQFSATAVADTYAGYPQDIRAKLMHIRARIIALAKSSAGVGEITETLKWGEPAYLTAQSKSGTTIRLGWKAGAPDEFAIYFNCKTNLIDTFRTILPRTFRYESNRAIVFSKDDEIAMVELDVCLLAALTYHLRK